MSPPAGNHFSLDGLAVPFEGGETLMAAATRAGQYVPHLCWHPTLGQSGACRLCIVSVDGRMAAACTTPAAAGQVVENRRPDIDARRKMLLQMLFVEGNHFCPSCEKSGDCLLLYTDGVNEAANSEGDEFGMPLLTETFRKAAPGGAQAVLDAFKTAVSDFAGSQPQSDDITIIVVQKK